MNELDQRIHKAIHEHMMSIHPDQIFSDRVGVFDFVEKKIGFSISGTGLDIGCGSGYASIWLAKNRDIKTIYAQEASVAGVEQLLPRNITYHQVERLVVPLPGSFDALTFNEELDFTVSFGALHHSICLFSTMNSISKSLKDGGYLIAQEPVMPNTTTNQDYINKYNIIETIFNFKIRNGDRNDNFFREAEYITAASFAGLDLVLYEDFAKLEHKRGSTNLLHKLRSYIGRHAIKQLLLKLSGRVSASAVPEAKRELPEGDLEYRKKVMRKIFVFKKKKTEYIPHVWRGLAR